MEFLVWFMGMCMVLVLLASIFKPDMMRYLSRNDRVRKSTSNARDNVRITNVVSNVVYRPVERAPLSDDGWSLYTMMSITSPYHVLEVELHETAFKQSPDSVFDSGVSRMRIAVNGAGKAVETVATHGVSVVNGNPMLSPAEMEVQLERTEQKLIGAEGDLMEQKANERRQVEDTMENVRNITSSKNQPRPRS